jgi:hypothetical protein
MILKFVSTTVRSKAFTATNINKIFSGYQPCQLVKNHQRFREMVPETSVVFNQLARLMTREDFIIVSSTFVETLDKLFVLLLVHLNLTQDRAVIQERKKFGNSRLTQNPN